MNKKSKHEKEVQKLAEEILSREVTKTPYDFIYRQNMKQYPDINHEELNLPGIYNGSEDPKIFVPDDGVLEMDYLESVLPDGEKIFRPSAVNAEQETRHITTDKKETIFEYWLNSIINLKKIVYPYVITNYDYKQDFIDYYVEGIPIRINLVIFNDKKIEEILNTLKKKDYSKEEFTSRDHVRFNHCLIFAKKPYACEVVNQLAELFTTIRKVTDEIHRDLFTSLCMMIKYHLKDYAKKKELIIMMLESMPYEQYKNLSYDERMKYELAELQNGIDIRDNIIDEKEKTINEKNKTINEKDRTINEKNKTINEKDRTIGEKDKEILKLQKLLDNNGIKF